MKLYKILITPEDEIPAEPDFIIEAADRNILKRKAEALATADYGVSEFIWVFGDNEKQYSELTIDGQCRFVVKP
jgi:choline kinase